IDSDYRVWRAFDNRYWPAVYLADAGGKIRPQQFGEGGYGECDSVISRPAVYIAAAGGKIRHHQFGEGGYDECERVIQRLLQDAGRDRVDDDLVSVAPTGFEVQADWADLQTPETYLGYEQAQNFESPDGVGYDEPRTYFVPDPLRLNRWALSGDWTIERGSRGLNAADGGGTCR